MRLEFGKTAILGRAANGVNGPQSPASGARTLIFWGLRFEQVEQRRLASLPTQGFNNSVLRTTERR
jgi:hypothetical protein